MAGEKATLSEIFRNAPQTFGLYYGAAGTEGPNEASWGPAPGQYPNGEPNTADILGKLDPYMNMTADELSKNWSSIPEDLRASLGNTPDEFAAKLSYSPDGRGGYVNTFVEKGEGLGDYILPAAIALFGVYTEGFGFSELINSSGGGIGSWVTDTVKGWGEGLNNLLSGAPGSVDASWEVNAVTETAGNTGVSSIIEGTTGIGVNPADMLQGPTNVTSGLTEFAPTQNIGADAVFNGSSASSSAAIPTGADWLDRSIDFVNKNQGLVSGAMQVGGGLLKGIGDRSTALEIADKRIAADKELINAKTQAQIDLENAKRGIIQSGSYFDAKVPIRPAGKVLLRPDGTPVYKGLVNSQVG